MPLTLSSPDHHTFSCFEATPDHTPKGAVVVIQEIFGVNAHIRDVCKQYAKQGYRAIAPALFDRIRPGIELGYGPEDRPEAMALAFKQLTLEQAVLDIQTTVDHAATTLKVGVVGYCFGGLLAWLAACELNNVAAVSSYYGGGIGRFKDKQPRCPVQLHFGKLDTLIPLAEVESVQALHPGCEVFLYDAGHGFNCDQRPSFEPQSSQLAFSRTLALLEKHLTRQ